MAQPVDLITVAEAQAIVLEHAETLPGEITPVASSALGLALAEDIAADLDMPPYDKSLMDGYAVRAEDLPNGKGELSVIEEVTAGNLPTKSVGQGEATCIMTGAPIPDGCDAIVMRERCSGDPSRVTIDDPSVKIGQNILKQASEMRDGETVLRAGDVIRPQEMGLLATVGKTAVKLIPQPRVAIISTGDELIEPMRRPRPGQIRNGNGPMLVGQVSRAGGLPRYLGIARDEVDHLRSLIKEGLDAPILILTGGVSAGNLDLVPGVLEELGVVAKFHRIKVKPGKPLFFGIKEHENRPPTLIFGLPGNPVSSLVCFELCARPAIRKLMGLKPELPREVNASLKTAYPYKTDRPTYHPAVLSESSNGWEVEMVPWMGSPDLRALTNANALALLPVGDHQHAEGQPLTVIPL